MVWICDKCVEDQHESCNSKWQCDCKCNVGGRADLTQKCLAIVGGTTLAVTGLAVTLYSGGLAAAIFGSTILGAGFGSTWNAASKTIKGERIDRKAYANDVTLGAVTAIFTSRLDVTTGTIATNIVQQAVTIGVQKLVDLNNKDKVHEVQHYSKIDKQCSDTDNELLIRLCAASSNLIFNFSKDIFSDVRDAAVENQEKTSKSTHKERQQTTNVHHGSQSEEQKTTYRSAIRKYDSDIQAEISLRNKAIKHRDIPSIREHREKIAELMQQLVQEIIKLNSITTHDECMNNDVKPLDSNPPRRTKTLYNYNTDYDQRLKVAEAMLHNAIYNLR